MIRRSEGYITLTITSFILLAALILVMGSYKQVFFQIKRAQNEVKSRQDHWTAEGGLECIYARAHVDKVSSGNVSACSNQPELTMSLVTSSNGKMATAQVGSTILEKEIQYGGSLGSGALQSSADLFLRGANAFDTPDPGTLTSDGWKCVAARYKSTFKVLGTIQNKGVVHGYPPWAGFDGQGKDCKTANKTTTNGNGTTSLSTGDFVKDSSVAPFENFYGIPVNEAEKVRDNGNFHILTGSAITSGTKVLSNCGTKIKNAIHAGNEFIWVEGGCEISKDEYPSLVAKSAATPNGVTLVVNNGPISLISDTTSGEFKGVLFHINSTYSPDLSDWNSLPGANPFLNPVGASDIPSAVRANASYYQSGSFTFSGGQYLDSSGHSAIFNNAVSLSFNKDVIDYSRSKNSPPKWVKGSWNDF